MECDSLTGLLNHTKTKEYLDKEISRAARQGSGLAFAMLDIDRFKSINDTYGHPAGDRVIVSLSRLLRQRLRKTDIVGRYGGEEFALVLAGADEKSAAKVVDEIRLSFGQVRHNCDGAEFSATFSCGVAGFPRYGDAISLCNAADKALYEAKHKGRNMVVLAQEQEAR
jgi:diguanylate cyclase (GGDEF)-like protein